MTSVEQQTLSGGTAAFGTETVTHAGSGLVFVNTYGSGTTTALHDAIVAAETYLETHFTDSVTLNVSFDLQAINPAFSAQDSSASVAVTYDQLVNALQTHATSQDDIAAVNALRLMADPSGGELFTVPNGQAKLLGLPGSTNSTDESIVLNSAYWTDTSITGSPGDAIAVLIHELTRGAMGRIGGLWGPMDLFRYTASGQLDDTGGQDGQLTYFSPDGHNINTGLQFHNPINAQGQDDGFDWADWDQVGQDASAHDPFGPGGPGAGDPGTLSATDLQIMDVLGWTESRPNLTGAIDTTFTEKQAPVTLSPSISVSDLGSTTLASATVKISGGTFAGDGDVLGTSTAGTAISASYNSTTETLVLTGTDTLADYQAVLDKVTFSASSPNPTNFGSASARTVTWILNDGIAASAVTTTVNITAVNDAPTLTNVTAARNFAAGHTVTIAPAASVSDPDNRTLVSATVKVTGGTFAGDGDVLAASTSGTSITASYNAATEMLTLTGSDTIAHYSQVLESVTFTSGTNPTNSGANPTRTLSWVLNDGSSSNNLGTVTSTVTIGAIVKNDFNGDLQSDLLFRDASTGSVRIWDMNGTSVALDVSVAAGVPAAWVISGTGDFNGDGTTDILWRNTSSGELDTWFINNGHYAGGTAVTAVPAVWQVAGTGDFNGDGTSDILWRNTSTGEFDTWFINNGHYAGGTAVNFVPSAWQVAGTGDFNGDGTSDIIWRNTVTGEVDTWFINNGHYAGGTAVNFVPSAWQVAGTGDFNGDGTSDILWRNTATGEVDNWLIQNGHWSGGANLGFVSSTTQVVGTGDYNGDSKADILLQNNTNGTPQIWTVNSTTVTATTTLTNPGPTWHATTG